MLGLVTFIEFEFGQDVIDGSLFIFVNNGYKNKIKMITMMAVAFGCL